MRASARSIPPRPKRCPGVVAVLTSKDLDDIGHYMGRGKNKDQPIIATGRVIYAGQPVAAVAALDRATAEEALSKIHVDYEELPAVITVDEATADGAPRLHEFAEKNICARHELVKGDVEKGFAEADVIVEDEFEFPMIYHYSMEPHTSIAQVDSDGITIWTSTGHPFGVRADVAEVFHTPLSKVRVHVNYVGGAYGSKSGGKIEPLVAALARKAKRPVRVVTSVAEAMATCRRHALKCKVKTGVKNDGTLVAKQAEMYLNTGAYAETGPTVTGRTLTRILGPYRYPNLKINSYCVYTNTVSAASFRSIGGPQTSWATESQMDIIAHKLGIDPVELRRKNLVKKDEELRPGYKPLDTDLGQGLQAGHRQIGLGRTGVQRRPRPRLRLRHHRSRRAAGVDLDRAYSRRRQRGVHVRHFGVGPGRQDDHEPDHRRRAARAARPRDDKTDRHGVHALRPLHRFEPFDHGDGQGG